MEEEICTCYQKAFSVYLKFIWSLNITEIQKFSVLFFLIPEVITVIGQFTHKVAPIALLAQLKNQEIEGEDL